ncbi:hypothetical protein DPX16_7366 [Anabarilius grahami]|uniref:Uncharacterized protein n=1 Tax=Anabarilius grahami TaxID=495550 RepID=A0A3N0Z2E6_ANAGA|nr:hypothetical protein DPX16_7366 [Anabarilius grahami]
MERRTGHVSAAAHSNRKQSPSLVPHFLPADRRRKLSDLLRVVIFLPASRAGPGFLDIRFLRAVERSGAPVTQELLEGWAEGAGAGVEFKGMLGERWGRVLLTQQKPSADIILLFLHHVSD